MKKFLKNQKGLTLVELLAVIVILGIIAAIAVPAIANIIDNSRKDAHYANAESLYDAARLAVVGEDVSGSETFTVGDAGEFDLLALGYLEDEPDNPDGGSYDEIEVRYNPDPDEETYTIYIDPVFDNDGDGYGITEIRAGDRTNITDGIFTP